MAFMIACDSEPVVVNGAYECQTGSVLVEVPDNLTELLGNSISGLSWADAHELNMLALLMMATAWGFGLLKNFIVSNYASRNN